MQNKPVIIGNHLLSKMAILLVLISFYTFSEATEHFDFRKAGKIIVLDEGRKKPLHTYAKKKLIQISGRGKIGGMSALEWFLKLMFNPGTIDTVQCFRISNPETVDALGIQGPYKRRYRYTELYSAIGKCEQFSLSALKKKSTELMPYEREMLQLWNNIKEYNALSSVYSVFDPFEALTVNDSALASSLHLLVNYPYSFSELIGYSSTLSTYMKEISKHKPDSLTKAELELVRLVRTMHAMGSQMQNSPPFLVQVMDNGNEEWHSIWGYLNKSGNIALKDKRVLLLLNLRDAYLSRDITAIDRAVNGLTATKYKNYPHPDLEILYNNFNPFFWAKIIFAFAGIFTLLTMFGKQRWIGYCSLIFIGTGLLLQTSGLLLRIFIQMHPPLASLYETFVFVSWIIVILGTGLELIQKRNIGTLIASFGGLLFLVISDRYAVNGDTFGVITAVLNSRFWLTIHIVTISIGYAGFLISGLLGHVHLIQSAFKINEKVTESTYRAVYLFLIVGLAFTVAGTVLGGMWADQAWGRFWGWDPKENGALLIILWGSTVIHARKGKLIGHKLTSAFAVIGILIVMLAWIGVNLLGVGLHSYGFTYSGMGILASVFIFEIIFLIIFGILAAHGSTIEKHSA